MPLLFENDCEPAQEPTTPAVTHTFPLAEPYPGRQPVNHIENESIRIIITGQRCSGRNYQGRRCCTPDNPCDEGEGDCDGPGDGGGHDGHAGCKGELVCGTNNCKKFGTFYHEKDDCCEKASATANNQTANIFKPETFINLIATILSPAALKEPPPGKNSKATKMNTQKVFQVKDAAVVIIKAEDVVHLKIHVMKERETAMDLVMEVVMMVIQVVKESLCVEVTTARNLVRTTMKRMIAVRNHRHLAEKIIS